MKTIFWTKHIKANRFGFVMMMFNFITLYENAYNIGIALKPNFMSS